VRDEQLVAYKVNVRLDGAEAARERFGERPGVTVIIVRVRVRRVRLLASRRW